MTDSFEFLPGNDLFQQGLCDYEKKIISEHSLLLLIALPRLIRLELSLGEVITKEALDDSLEPPHHRLYSLLEEQYGRNAYSRYNALLRRMVSFCASLEREKRSKRIS